MAIQHSQHSCTTCRKATLHVRSTYDVPHVAHLLIGFAIGIAGLLLSGSLQGLWLGIAWLPIWMLHIVARGLTPPPWRCQACGTAHEWFPRFARKMGTTIAAMRPVRPAGPSSRAKVASDKCPTCGRAMVPGLELGAEVLSCGRCGQTFERGQG